MNPPTATHSDATAPEKQARSKYSCVACGGEAVWNPAKQKLVCAFCGTEMPLPPASEAMPGLQSTDIVEHDLVAALRDLSGEARGWARTTRMIKCRQCQAISVFDATKQAKACEFCGASAIVDYDETGDVIRPEAILPIQVSEPQARDRLRAWYGKLWWAPNALKKKAMADRVSGLYLPYWTFDAMVDARWQAEAGYYYYETETYFENGEQRSRQVQRVRWEYASGSLNHFFDDTLVCGSRGVREALLRNIEPFPTTEKGTGALKPYDPAYVSGWTVERYQIDLIAAAKLSRERMLGETRGLCSQQVPGDTQRNLQVDANFSRQTFKHILAPVWLLTYVYANKDYQVVMNAVTGKLDGEYPKSWVKITLAVIVVLIVLLVVFAGGGGRHR
ncbi:MAG: zinc ribbon domain-containing protein [Burkholderiales bacterium]|nr:zinc ribbon domain-containing protein [Burkholderiales bacterium]